MTANTKGSFWTSTAAIVTAIGTLLVGLAAVVTLVIPKVIHLVGGSAGPPGSNAGGSGTSSPAGPGQPADESILDQQKFGAEGTSAFELDGTQIVRNPSTNEDVYFFWSLGGVSTSSGGYMWTGDDIPNRAQCTDKLRTHGTGRVDSLEVGSALCVRTSAGRTARLRLINNGAEIEVVVWKQRT